MAEYKIEEWIGTIRSLDLVEGEMEECEVKGIKSVFLAPLKLKHFVICLQPLSITLLDAPSSCFLPPI
jgi:hypothetical protein